MRIQFQECQIRRVFEHYAKGFKMKKGEKLYNYETTYDPSTGVVVFKLYIENKENS